MSEASWFNRIRGMLTGSQLPAGVTLLHTLEGARDGSDISFGSWSPDGKLIRGFNLIYLWDPATGVLLRTLEGRDPAVWSPDGKLLASNTGDNKTIHLWDPATGTLLRTLESDTTKEESTFSLNLVWSPDSRLLASYGHGRIQLWEPATGLLLHTLKYGSDSQGNPVWSPDSRLLASCTGDGRVHLCDPITGKLLHTLTYPRGERDSSGYPILAWSPDSRLLASGRYNGRVRLWDPTTGALLRTLKGHKDTSIVNSLVWSPDSKLLASSVDNYDNQSDKLRLWDPTTGVSLHIFKHKGSVNLLDWSPDGKLLVASDHYQSGVYIWRMDTWECLAVIKGLQTYYPVAWHPGLPLLVTPGIQKMTDLCVWHLDLARLLQASPSSERISNTDTKTALSGMSSVNKQIAPSINSEKATTTLQYKIATQDFDVFLCHNGQDKPAVKQIGEQLKDHDILPWLDEWELRPGLPWQRLLEQQIEHIKSAAVFVGKNGIAPWQQQELEAFLRAFVKRGCPVIPVLLQNTAEKPKLPLFLEGMTWVDFRLRDPDPLQQLIWGITGKQRGRS